jgi:hypothetical protein
MSNAPHCATFRRHLGRQIARAFTARPTPLDTVELAQWAYPGRPINNWMRANVRRHLDQADADDRQGRQTQARLGAAEAGRPLALPCA